LNTKKKIASILSIVLVLTFPLTTPNPYTLQFGINMLMFAYLASAWNIIGGYAGQMALGNVVYFGIGAYTSSVLFMYEGVSPWIGMIVGALIAGGLSLLLGSLTFRLSGSYYSLSTVALLHVIRLIFISNPSMFGYKTNGALGLYLPWGGDSFINIAFTDKYGYYYIIFAFLVGVLFISHKIKNSKMGYYLAAINTNQEAAASLGVPVMGMKLKAGFISAALTAIGGTYYVQMLQVVDPSRVFGYDFSVQILFYAIIGGRGTLFGPVLAAFLMAPLNDFLRGWFGSSVAGLYLVIYGLILMVIIYYLPNGIWPFFQKMVDLLLGDKKSSRKIKQKGGN